MLGWIASDIACGGTAESDKDAKLPSQDCKDTMNVVEGKTFS